MAAASMKQKAVDEGQRAHGWLISGSGLAKKHRRVPTQPKRAIKAKPGSVRYIRATRRESNGLAANGSTMEIATVDESLRFTLREPRLDLLLPRASRPSLGDSRGVVDAMGTPAWLGLLSTSVEPSSQDSPVRGSRGGIHTLSDPSGVMLAARRCASRRQRLRITQQVETSMANRRAAAAPAAT
mmetsp:Transcript_6073/g.18657  ORF Transcript_6073/g.18657 Transcript_6073/m.18657 type:complete len:184 (+) Transcript_6073:218-769(+)|eukprot:scaffold169401_cov25-Tisochrysis_lutea.AAC.1